MLFRTQLQRFVLHLPDLQVHLFLVKLFQGACNFAASLKDITGIDLQPSTSNSNEPGRSCGINYTYSRRMHN